MKNCILVTFCILLAGPCLAQEEIAFSSSDTALQTAFAQAREMALQYKGKPGDPVGPWYESALPPRYAFCMRDVSHQSIGGEILHLGEANKNMFSLFVNNISESKDWCSYWEINRYGNPAPEDYRNDSAFWYNLNANFDVLNACWKLYLWTGDKDYINSPRFRHFFNKTAQDYITSWQLTPGLLLHRQAHPNAPADYNEADAFHRCRGLPSYSEGVPNMKMGVDLVAAIYRGLMSYASILRVQGNNTAAAAAEQRAALYQEHIDKHWWNQDEKRYNTYYSNNGEFGINEGETFLLWFNALKDSARKAKTLEHLVTNNWNVENLSYFPLIMYENGRHADAFRYVLKLTNPATQRREYPEVSFGVVKGIVEGLMGIRADARRQLVTTLYRHYSNSVSAIEGLALLGTRIKLTHDGKRSSTLVNRGQKNILWRAEFQSAQTQLLVNGKKVHASTRKGETAGSICFAEVPVKPGESVTVSISGGK